MLMNWKDNRGNTKRDVDIVYGVTTFVACILWPPAAIALGGAWLADRGHYPDHLDNNNQDNQ